MEIVRHTKQIRAITIIGAGAAILAVIGFLLIKSERKKPKSRKASTQKSGTFSKPTTKSEENNLEMEALNEKEIKSLNDQINFFNEETCLNGENIEASEIPLKIEENGPILELEKNDLIEQEKKLIENNEEQQQTIDQIVPEKEDEENPLIVSLAEEEKETNFQANLESTQNELEISEKETQSSSSLSGSSTNFSIAQQIENEESKSVNNEQLFDQELNYRDKLELGEDYDYFRTDSVLNDYCIMQSVSFIEEAKVNDDDEFYKTTGEDESIRQVPKGHSTMDHEKFSETSSDSGNGQSDVQLFNHNESEEEAHEKNVQISQSVDMQKGSSKKEETKPAQQQQPPIPVLIKTNKKEENQIVPQQVNNNNNTKKEVETKSKSKSKSNKKNSSTQQQQQVQQNVKQQRSKKEDDKLKKSESIKENDEKSAKKEELDYEDLVVYEFNFPRKFCGKLIGKNGIHVDFIRSKTHTQIAVRNDPVIEDLQIVCVSGKLEDVDHALDIISSRFPVKYYPQISFKPISKPIVYRRHNLEKKSLFEQSKVLVAPNMFAQLSDVIKSSPFNVHVTAVVNAAHLFIQLPDNSTLDNLRKLDESMLEVYGNLAEPVPTMSEPIEIGTICAAPTSFGWHRAMITNYQTLDETLKQMPDYTESCGLATVKFLDYGGYLVIPSDQLRQLRSDFMLLPFQAIECYLDGIFPYEGTEENGKAFLSEFIKNSTLRATVIGNSDEGIPLIKLYITNDTFQNTNVNKELINYGLVFSLADQENSFNTSLECSRSEIVQNDFNNIALPNSINVI